MWTPTFSHWSAHRRPDNQDAHTPNRPHLGWYPKIHCVHAINAPSFAAPVGFLGFGQELLGSWDDVGPAWVVDR